MPNGNDRGSTSHRRARKLWLISEEAGWGGNGEDVPCWECGVVVELVDLIADRIIPAERGGTYARSNIAPHCPLCSHRQGNRAMRRAVIKRASAAWLAARPYLARV